MRLLTLIAALLPLGGNALLAPQAHAEDAEQKPAHHCIDVEVNGERIRDYDCLGKLLTPSQDSAARPPAQLRSEEIAGHPATALGLANREATRQRMGNTFGKSTLPQRPSQPVPTLPPAFRRP
ncbi:hypothetical protein [Pseudothauera rhizosphaerae]|uniref:Uncharacterized protein n=1 Tax=Pseudothauera rhizosphaerae TaxID=2565932 RepID=A0A4S4AHD2_9RHOO|nr:hypothetical protein [Pseudothauera rhizosphaerae]THF58682.1 hypothetical protein E6O51_16980 [Pseudothauera rhizosphaerae]